MNNILLYRNEVYNQNLEFLFRITNGQSLFSFFDELLLRETKETISTKTLTIR